MSFPSFNGAAGKDAQEFLDNLEIACLVTGGDDDATRLQVFSLLMKAKAKVWFNTLLPANREDWAGLRVLFLAKFGGGGETSESLWGKVCELRQGSLFEYNVYEVQFVELWEKWVASLRLGEAALDFLKKDRFVAGLCPPLREKVKGRFPMTWMDARDIARLKERKIRYQLQQRKADQEEEGMASVHQQMHQRLIKGKITTFQFIECNFRYSQVASNYEELRDAQEDLDDLSNLLDKAEDWHEGREGKRRKLCSSVRRIQMLQEAIESLTEKYEDQFQEEDKSDDEWGGTTSIFPLVGKSQVQSCLTSPNALAMSPKSMKEIQPQSQPEEVKKVMLERGEEEEHPKSQRSQKEHLVSQSHTPNRLNGLQDAEELESNIERYLQSGQEIEDRSGPKTIQGPKEDMEILIEDMQSSKCIEGFEGTFVPKNLQKIEFVKDRVTVHDVQGHGAGNLSPSLPVFYIPE
ncbi:hypothetical protein L7F22_067666 [Adiantum nelumboides]|nr:hypothetical protein [Adiantum nelumboides]